MIGGTPQSLILWGLSDPRIAELSDSPLYLSINCTTRVSRHLDVISLGIPPELLAGPMANWVLLWFETQKYWVRIPVCSDIYHRGCAYTVLQTVQISSVCSAVYGT